MNHTCILLINIFLPILWDGNYKTMMKISLYSIPTARYIELSEELGVIFSSNSKSAEEVKIMFYYPYQRSTKTRAAVNQGGALYERMNYEKDECSLLDMLESSSTDGTGTD